MNRTIWSAKSYAAHIENWKPESRKNTIDKAWITSSYLEIRHEVTEENNGQRWKNMNLYKAARKSQRNRLLTTLSGMLEQAKRLYIWSDVTGLHNCWWHRPMAWANIVSFHYQILVRRDQIQSMKQVQMKESLTITAGDRQRYVCNDINFCIDVWTRNCCPNALTKHRFGPASMPLMQIQIYVLSMLSNHRIIFYLHHEKEVTVYGDGKELLKRCRWCVPKR